MCKKYSVKVNFKNNRDFSNDNKMEIINALPGTYKENFDSLNDMNNKKVRSFDFPKKEIADNFAKRLFKDNNKIFNIETDEPID
ncbi:MAG: hypothetical protein RBR54_05000 [Sulfurimonas sp.]|jgi:hypothetical protein|nr:hypothetical protein [Sulfurimonas sp.]